ncbi:hypothetical protein [Arenibaculum pallidiluteum]|uniref:hypothetical protein n=1 Tax=Arenibaculum pallidiluteum TaxID=2812559 RepID=UPI001A9723DC|nr:hypothetical protein [Arenibaculum pallidiluteum]
MNPGPEDARGTPSGEARAARRSPDDLPPHAQVDTPARLRATQAVLLAVLALLLIGLAFLLLD